MIKNVLLLVIILYPVIINAQEKTKQTSSFSVTGEVKNSVTVDYAAVEKLKPEDIGTVMITNHLGEPKGPAKDLKGVKMKDLLAGVELNAENPRVNSTFYFVFIASDGYKVVYSWNEIFNSPTGEKIFLVTSKDGKAMKDMSESMLVITPSDYKTGRRYIKGLQTIDVRRIPN